MVKKGLTALRYLNVGNPIILELNIPIIEIIIEPKRNNIFRIFFVGELSFLIISQRTTNTVGSIIINPPIPKVKTNSSPGFSLNVNMKLDVRWKIIEDIIIVELKIGIAQIKKFLSFLKNGTMKK